jgi:hypothetical protein
MKWSVFSIGFGRIYDSGIITITVRSTVQGLLHGMRFPLRYRSLPERNAGQHVLVHREMESGPSLFFETSCSFTSACAI